MLTFYGDESGTHDRSGKQPGSDVVAVAGYIAKNEEWERFNDSWSNCLKQYGVSEFHMADCVPQGKNPPYQGWSRDKCDEFRKDLIKIARRHTLGGFGGLVIVEEYDSILPECIKYNGGYTHPYHFCFHMLIDIMLPELEKLGRPAGEQIAFVFDQQKEFGAGAKKLFESIKSLRDRHNILGSLIFGSSKQHLPLQAADLLVYTVRRDLSRFTMKQFREEFAKYISRNKHLNMKCCDQKGLKQYAEDVKNDTFKSAIDDFILNSPPQHPTGQQADNHQDYRKFDEGKAVAWVYPIFHKRRFLLAAKAIQNYETVKRQVLCGFGKCFKNYHFCNIGGKILISF